MNVRILLALPRVTPKMVTPRPTDGKGQPDLSHDWTCCRWSSVSLAGALVS
jgi:hypothetical protein